MPSKKPVAKPVNKPVKSVKPVPKVKPVPASKSKFTPEAPVLKRAPSQVKKLSK